MLAGPVARGRPLPTCAGAERRVCLAGGAGQAARARAAAALREGGLVAVPTDTVYGVACLAQDSAAVEALYRLKGRPAGKPLAICLGDVEQVQRCAGRERRRGEGRGGEARPLSPLRPQVLPRPGARGAAARSPARSRDAGTAALGRPQPRPEPLHAGERRAGCAAGLVGCPRPGWTGRLPERSFSLQQRASLFPSCSWWASASPTTASSGSWPGPVMLPWL